MTAVSRSNTSVNLLGTILPKPVPPEQSNTCTLQCSILVLCTQCGQCSSTKIMRSKVCKLVFNNVRQWSNDKQCNAILIVTHLQLCKGLVNTNLCQILQVIRRERLFCLITALEHTLATLFKLMSILQIFFHQNLLHFIIFCHRVVYYVT